MATVGPVSEREADWPGGFSAPCVRNSEPILNVLTEVLANSRQVLEIGSCTGQHAVAFATALAHLVWQPTDQALYLPGLQANLQRHAPANLLPALQLDVQHDDWPATNSDAVFTANTLHIMSLVQVAATFAGVGNLLKREGLFLIYGPFNYGGEYTSASNQAFDAALQQRDPLSGIRDIEHIASLADRQALQLANDFAMPANNRLLVWRKT
jgi:hypothetical protein